MGASFILAINIAIGLAVMASFLAFALFDRAQKPAMWWFAACVFGVIAGLIEYSLPPVAFTGTARFLIHTVFALAMCCLSIGLAQRYTKRVPWLAFAIALGASVLAYLSIADAPRDSLMRNVVYQAPYAGIGFLGLYYVIGGMKRHLLDRAVATIVAFYALHYLVRPPLVIFFGGNGETAQQYLNSDYAMASQTLMAISTIAIAVVLGIRTATDVFINLQRKSDLDILSGILNRNAYQREVDRALQPLRRGGRAMALVLCDLDHFKAINDTYGHAFGDSVIKAFGSLLQGRKRRGDLIGRIGGEEFCILLDNCNLAGARLFAEAVRAEFEAAEAGPEGELQGCTASFGVSEVLPGEGFEAVFLRADKALYEAKRAGRNCVRTSSLVAVDPPSRQSANS